MLLINTLNIMQGSTRLKKELYKSRNNAPKLDRMWGHLKGHAVEQKHINATFNSRKLIPSKKIKQLDNLQLTDFNTKTTKNIDKS